MFKIDRVDDFTAALAIRRAVFIDEQGVSETDEVDGLDPDCLHWLASDADGPVATLRVLPKGEIAKIQRVAVLTRARGTGLGAALMTQVLQDLGTLGYRRALLGSQMTAIGFYERLGFTAEGPVYDDAGLPHRDMFRDI